MSGDYSRVRFDPRIDLSGVQMQQGRVQLDSDWNEWVAVLDRRLRAESVDTFGVHVTPGITGVAVVSPQTPNAFEILATGGNITIGRGRMYVDGLLAENHGGGTPEFDPVLAELRGQTALAYNQQPYFPAPPALPSGGPHLAYLEVWQREVTHLQQPNLVESAVGVDTTTRTQTVWQVRMLANFSGTNCTTPDASVAGWQALTLPSGGRMSIKAEGVPPDLDPCELPPSGGYRGLENQLYRIEIHDGGPAGTATFKWSRDNASVASNVTEIVSQTATATELKLASLGRDAVLRFNTGDWVEILDDRRELSGENGDPALRRGVMRKITVDDAKQTVSFTPALPADLIPGGGLDTLSTRHTRVRRWDQKGTVRDSSNNVIGNIDADGGLIKVPTGANVWVTLENGIQVQLSLEPTGGGYRCDDYWVSAARTADTSVETFTQAPPRGIHHHYARLSIVTFPDGETDCRVKWPPECGGCCTVNVAPGDNIQAAIDSLPVEGGCVCLKTGVHNISAAIQIHASRIILRGESPGAIVRSVNLPTMLQIASAGISLSDIVVEGIRFEAQGAPTTESTLLYLSLCTRVRVEHCEIIVLSPQQVPLYAGISIDNASEIDIVDNRLKALLFGIKVKNCKPRLRIAGNLITGLTSYQFGNDNFSFGQYGVYIENDSAADCRIEDNQLSDFWTAVCLKHGADGSLVSGNRILRSHGTVPGAMPTNITELRQYLDQRLYAIDVEAAGCVVRDNYINLPSAAWGGVRVIGAEVTVAENTLEANDAKMGTLRPATIYCLSSATQGLAADHAVIQDNQAIGPQLGIVASRVKGVQIERNHIDGGPAAGWFGLRIDDSTDTQLRDNVLREIYFGIYLSDGERNQVTGNNVSMTAMGISSTNEAGLEVAHNTVQSALFNGIGLYVKNAAVLHNRVLNCGYFGVVSIGIAVVSEDVYSIVDHGALVRIEGCEVIDTGISADGSQATTANAVGIGGGMAACEIINNRVGYTQADKMDVQKEHRALLLIGPFGLHYSTGPGEFAYMLGSALIEGNHFRGPGKTSLVELMRVIYTPNVDSRFEKVTFNNNLCDHLSAEANTQGATVRLWGGHLIAMGNHVKAAANVNAMSLANRKTALMGNVTTGNYTGANNVTPLPVINFNVRV